MIVSPSFSCGFWVVCEIEGFRALEEGMGVKGGEEKVEGLVGGGTGKSKVVGRKKGVESDDDDVAEGTGCWIKLRFMGSCISSKSKVDTSVSGPATTYGNFTLFCFCFLQFLLRNFSILFGGFIYICVLTWGFFVW